MNTNEQRQPTKYDNLTIEQLEHMHRNAIIAKQESDKLISEITAEVYERNRDQIPLDKTGTVNLDGVKVKIPKNVKWDQEILSNLYKEIGDTANEYIDVVYKVKEAAYNNWPIDVKDHFTPARTVSTGKMKIEFKENK